MPNLRLYVLGPPRLERDGVPVEFDRRKNVALVSYLGSAGERHTREALITLLWPELEPSRARGRLRRDLSVLRKALGGAGLVADRETIGLDPSADLWVDVDQFRSLLQARRGHGHHEAEVCPDCLVALAEAVELYRGDFLAGFSLRDSVTFDEWQFFQTEGLRQELATALEQLVRGHSAQGAYEAAIAYARRWLALDSLHEPVHRYLMQLYVRAGQRAAALRQYRECERILEAELGLLPSEETVSLYQQIRARPANQGKSLFAAPLPEPEPPVPPLSTLDRPAPPVRLEGERRLATVVFADVVGSTLLMEQIGTEEWVEVVNRVFQILGSEVYRFGGEIDQYRGDRVVAFFGVPVAHEDDPERAVLAALAMQEATRRYAAELGGRGRAGTARPIELRLRIGVNTGEVIATSISGRDRHRKDVAMGAAVALAAGVVTAAEPGTVLVSENTYRVVEPLFQWESLGEAEVEGASRPVAVYRPLRARFVGGKGRGTPGLKSPLVGREAEFRALGEAIQGLRAGVGGVVTLVGEAGIGKSRLVTEARTHQAGRDAGTTPLLWVEGRCLSYGASTAYHVWLDILRGLLEVAPDAPAAAVGDALRQWVQALCPDSFDDIYPYLARLMSLPLYEIAAATVSDLRGEELRARTFAAVATLIECATRQRPLLLVCEDLHWADPTSLELLKQLLPLTDRASLLLLCVFRPRRDRGCWDIREVAARYYPHRHSDVWLRPLSPADSEVLVGNLLQVETIGPVLSERVLRTAEGNPLFVEEILRGLIDQGAVVVDEGTGGWVITEGAAELDLPATLQGVLVARIDRLPAETHRVLQMASVIGRIFLYRVLAALAGEQRELPGQLVVLQRQEMIRERARLPEPEYIFKHELTREAAYNGLLKKARRTLHRQVAEALEGLFADRLEEQVELLAHHWDRSGEAGPALRYLLQAAEKAVQLSAYGEAIAHGKRGLEVLQRLPDTRKRAEQELRLQAALGTSLQAAEGYHAPALEPVYTRSLELCQRLERWSQLSPVMFGLRTHYIFRGEWRKGREVAERLLAMVQTLPVQDAALSIGAHWTMVYMLCGLGEHVESLRYCERALALHDPQEHRSLVAHGYVADPKVCLQYYKALNLCILGHPEQAQRSLREGLAWARELDHPYSSAYALFSASVLTQLGREARATQERAGELIAFTTEHGFLALRILGESFRGWALSQQGRVKEGVVQMRRTIGEARATGWSGANLPWFLVYLAEACRLGGWTEEGLTALEEALARAESTGERWHVAEVHRLQGELLLMQGGMDDEAEASFRRALELAQEQQARWWELRAVVSLCRLWQRQGKVSEARALLGGIYDWFSEGFDTVDLREAKALLDQLS